MMEGLERPQIQVCESRLALSASLVGDLLVEALSLQGDIEAGSVDDAASRSPDLVEQAAQLRAEQGLDGSGQSVVVLQSGGLVAVVAELMVLATAAATITEVNMVVAVVS